MLRLNPISLAGDAVELVPLSRDHRNGLVEAVRDGELWRIWYANVPAPEDMDADIDRRLRLRDEGSALPFTVVDRVNNEIVGMTSYLNIDRASPRLEVGSTLYAARVQRTLLNTEAKLLLLSHAFERLDCLAVEFRTHVMNQVSRRAIERLGAKLDGVLRQHIRMRDGSVRDTCVYSVVSAEWPAVRSNLRWRLER